MDIKSEEKKEKRFREKKKFWEKNFRACFLLGLLREKSCIGGNTFITQFLKKSRYFHSPC
jgi:threonine/homoserine/homoserine lactone efflux protein